MANVKISELPIGTPSSTSIFPFVDGGTTYQGAISALTSNSTFEVTYSELVDKLTGGTLNTGSFYIITDYQTIYDQPDFDQNGLEIVGGYKIGDIEPLVVLATSGNTLAPQAYSPTYPKDKITYDITFTQTERTNTPAKGRITERIDDRNNRADYDLRGVMFKRYNMYYSDQIYLGKIDITVEGVVTGYGTNFTGDFNVDDVFGVYVGAYQAPVGCFKYFKILTVDSNSGMTVTGKTMINETNLYYSKGRQYFQKISPFQTNIINDLDYFEYKTFPAGVDAYNVYIGDFANYFAEEGFPFLLSNNVFLDGTHQMITLGDLSANNSFDDDLNSLVFGTDTYNNIITNDFDRNSLGNNFSNNIIMCDMRDNFIQNYFQYNMLGDNDGYDFTSNVIGNSFIGNFTSFYNDGFENNVIGDNFRNNIIDDGFYRNQIGYNFYDNLIFRDFTDNKTMSDFNTNNIYGEFASNIVGVNFSNNTLGNIDDFFSFAFTDNQIGNSFNNNIIFSDFYKNQVGNNFYSNEISGQTTNNVIGNQFENNTIYSNFNHNKISNEFKGNMMLSSFEGNNVEPFIGGNQFSGGTYSNNIGSFTFDNDFLGLVADNSWGDNFNGNIIGPDFTNNSIGSNFYDNTIGYGFQYNEIGDNFFDNTIDENFGYGYTTTQGNKIGNNFFENIIGEYFYNNSIPDNFRNNQVGDYFQWNVINTDITETNFTLNYGNITGFSYTATGTSASDNLYLDVQICGTTESNGVGATFNIEVSGGSVIGVSGNTEGRLYKVNDTLRILGTQIGGVTGVIDGFSSDALGKEGADGSYTDIPTTGGNGGSATFDITVAGGVVIDIQLNNGGNGYLNGNTLTISGSLFGGVDDVDDITITVTQLYSDDVIITITGVTSGSLFYDHYTKQIFERRLGDKRVSFYDENDILNIDSVYEISGYIPVNSQSLTFPIYYTSFEFQCNGSYTNNGGYTGNQTNSTQDVVTLFNNSFRSSGYFFDNNDGTIGLYINPSLKKQFCPTGTYTINVFND